MRKASSVEAPPSAGNPPANKDRSLWLWVAGGFLLLGIAWALLFTAAHSAKIESVPLVTQGKS